MLCDHNRMSAYHSSIIGNAHLFKDKIVVDVGSGSGILAAWCALAGARRVFAVEYTDMASNAELVMKANKVDHIVTGTYDLQTRTAKQATHAYYFVLVF